MSKSRPGTDTPFPELGEGHARARLAAIVESSDDAIISKDLNGVITSWNRGAERLFGYTGEEAIGRSVKILIPPERLDEEGGILERVRRGERVNHYETIRRRKDGALLEISLTVSPIFDLDGVIVGASKIARDITAWKRAAERGARDQEAMLRLYEIGKHCVRPGDHFDENLEEMLATAVWISRADRGSIQLYDPASDALQIVAHQGLDASFLEFFARVRPNDVTTSAAALGSGERVFVEDVSTSEFLSGHETQQVLLAGGIRAVLTTPLISSQGTILGMVSTHFNRPSGSDDRAFRLLDLLARQMADYIERKRAELQRDELLRATESARAEAESANRTKDEFLAMLGHELRNPLSAVRNSISVAMLDASNRDRALEIARRQTDQLGRIVDDLLDVARITHGRVQMRKERFSLSERLTRTIEGARGLMDERGHTLTFRTPSDALFVEADAARVEQAVMNLLANAAKYTDPGGAVTVAAEREGTLAVVRVRDNGIGIPADVLPRVFDLFAQGDRSLDRAQGGLGIGLTLVRRIVELHGGTVEAKSAGVGAGAELILRIPLAGAPADRLATLDSEARTQPARAPTRVLMVEDNPDVADSLVMILELLGHHVRLVHDGPSALEAARSNVPDVMLIDIGLPGMNGYDVARSLRTDPALKHVVLVALTGYGRADDKVRAMAAGFDYHLVKPVDLDALKGIVGRLGVPEMVFTVTP